MDYIIFTDFLSFRCSYHLLYQSYKPTSLHIILKRYRVPESFGTQLLKQFNWRTVNQSLLNYLLIELRRDKDTTKFWETIRMMIEELQLKKIVDNYLLLKRGMILVCTHTHGYTYAHIYTRTHMHTHYVHARMLHIYICTHLCKWKILHL